MRTTRVAAATGNAHSVRVGSSKRQRLDAAALERARQPALQAAMELQWVLLVRGSTCRQIKRAAKAALDAAGRLWEASARLSERQ